MPPPPFQSCHYDSFFISSVYRQFLHRSQYAKDPFLSSSSACSVKQGFFPPPQNPTCRIVGAPGIICSSSPPPALSPLRIAQPALLGCPCTRPLFLFPFFFPLPSINSTSTLSPPPPFFFPAQARVNAPPLGCTLKTNLETVGPWHFPFFFQKQRNFPFSFPLLKKRLPKKRCLLFLSPATYLFLFLDR